MKKKLSYLYLCSGLILLSACQKPTPIIIERQPHSDPPYQASEVDPTNPDAQAQPMTKPADPPPNTRADAIIIDPQDHGLVADGVADDGPAILQSLKAARQFDGPVVIRFPQDAQIYVATGTNRYAFWLDGDQNLTIDGNGSEFLLDPYLRFMDAFECDDLKVVNLKVDFTTQPTTPGTIFSVNVARKSITVRLDDLSYIDKLGAPTREDGEQDFFGKIQLRALYGTTHVEHYYVEHVEVLDEQTVEVFNSKSNFQQLMRKVESDVTRVGLPVPGVAHRHGPGGLFVINHNRNVHFEDIEVWSAPWFSFQIFRNEGTATFRNVNIRPKPDSGKVLSSCRDAFHVKGNRATLLFEDCELRGLGDDAFNISTHASKIVRVQDDSSFRMVQNFPLQYFQPRVGDKLVFLDGQTNRLIGERRISEFSETKRRGPNGHEPSTFETRFEGWASAVDIVLEQPLEGLQKDWIVWIKESANPDTTIRNCQMYRSCRLMSSVLVEDCTIEAFTWFYGDHKEGPVPDRIVVRDSVLRSNSLGPKLRQAFSISGWNMAQKESDWEAVPENFPTKLVEFTNNEIWGRGLIRDALNVKLVGNRFCSDIAEPLTLNNCVHVVEKDNFYLTPEKQKPINNSNQPN